MHSQYGRIHTNAHSFAKSIIPTQTERHHDLRWPLVNHLPAVYCTCRNIVSSPLKEYISMGDDRVKSINCPIEWLITRCHESRRACAPAHVACAWLRPPRSATRRTDLFGWLEIVLVNSEALGEFTFPREEALSCSTYEKGHKNRFVRWSRECSLWPKIS